MRFREQGRIAGKGLRGRVSLSRLLFVALFVGGVDLEVGANVRGRCKDGRWEGALEEAE